MRPSASASSDGMTLCADCLEKFPDDWFPIISKKGQPVRRAKLCKKRGNNCYNKRKALLRKGRSAHPGTRYSEREALVAQAHEEGKRQRKNVIAARKMIET